MNDKLKKLYKKNVKKNKEKTHVGTKTFFALHRGGLHVARAGNVFHIALKNGFLNAIYK